MNNVDNELNMNTHNVKKMLFAVIAWVLVALIVLAPSTKAFNYSYTDNFLTYFGVSSSPDIVSPGGTVSANITGLLRDSSQSVVFHITYYVDTSSQTYKLVNAQDLYLSGNSIPNIAYTQITVPLDALSNTFVYAVISNGTITFSKVPIALVLNPTYSALQTQNLQLQANLTSLGAQVSSLQNQLETAKANSTNLQNQLVALNATYTSLLANYTAFVNNSTSDKFSMLNQISTLQNQLSAVNATNNNLQAQLENLQTQNSQLQTQLNEAQIDSASLSALQENNTSLQNQVNALKVEQASYLNQTSTLQAQVNRLQFNNTNMQSIVDNLNNQTITLRMQVEDLESTNGTVSILMYLASFVAVIFIVATATILVIVVKRKGKKTEEAPLY